MGLDIDRYATIKSPIQEWDARYKIAGITTWSLMISSIQTLPMAMFALLAAASLLAVARLPLDFIWKGTRWVLFFLLPFLVIMPLSYPNGTELHFLGIPFAPAGFRLALLVVIKAVAIVMSAYGIFATCRFDVAMIALQHLKCPRVLVQMLIFTYRYIFVFVGELERRETAMKARGFVAKTDAATLRILGNFVGTLLVRSFERTERIYKAMLSKGYQGEYHTMTEFRSTAGDPTKLALAVAATLVLFLLDHYVGFAQAELGWY